MAYPVPPEVPLSLEDISFAQSIASRWCRRHSSYISGDGCEWYHGNWKLLKRLGMVSEPRWHLRFYLTAVDRVIESSSRPRILICGAADEGMMSVVLKAVEGSRAQAQIVMLDLCPTPLVLSRSFSVLLNKRVNFTVGHALALPFPDATFDAVITDAFLTRFTKEETKTISREWARVLRPRGMVITTVRIRDDPTSPEFYRASLWERLKYSWRAVRRSFKDEISPLKALKSSWVFSGKMTSHTFGNIEQIREVLSDYEVSVELSEEKEEVSKRRYARIIAYKANRILRDYFNGEMNTQKEEQK